MTTAGTVSVTQRLDHLERQNRWLKLAGVAVLTLAGALVVLTHTGLRLFDANERPIWDAP